MNVGKQDIAAGSACGLDPQALHSGQLDQHALSEFRPFGRIEVVPEEVIISKTQDPSFNTKLIVLAGECLTSAVEFLERISARPAKGLQILLLSTPALAILAAQNYSTGELEVDPEIAQTALRAKDRLWSSGARVNLPVDVMVTSDPGAGSLYQAQFQNIPLGHQVLDIGPHTRMIFGDSLRNCDLVVWNGVAHPAAQTPQRGTEYLFEQSRGATNLLVAEKT